MPTHGFSIESHWLIVHRLFFFHQAESSLKYPYCTAQRNLSNSLFGVASEQDDKPLLPHSKYDLSYQSPITSTIASSNSTATGSSQNNLENRLGEHYVKTEPSGNKSDSSDSSRDDIVPLKNDVKMNRLLFSPLKNGGKSHVLDIEHYSPLQQAPTDVQLATVDNGELLVFFFLFFSFCLSFNIFFLFVGSAFMFLIFTH